MTREGNTNAVKHSIYAFRDRGESALDADKPPGAN